MNHTNAISAATLHIIVQKRNVNLHQPVKLADQTTEECGLMGKEVREKSRFLWRRLGFSKPITQKFTPLSIETLSKHGFGIKNSLIELSDLNYLCSR